MILWLLVAIPCLAHDDSGTRGDSGIFGPSYQTLLNQSEALQTQYPDLTTLIDYGKTVGGRTMRMLVVKRDVAISGERPTVIIDGTIHGNEFLNIEDRAPAAILGLANKEGAVNRFLERGGAFVFVPILNPDGYEKRRRENNNGKDLNRDWDVPSIQHKGFTQPETKLLAQKLAELKTVDRLGYKLNVDYHCCAGAAMHPRAYTTTPIPSAEYDRLFKLGSLSKQIIGCDYGSWMDVLGYLARGTTLDYFFETYGTYSFTFEGEYGSENKRFNQHVNWWQAMLERIS